MMNFYSVMYSILKSAGQPWYPRLTNPRYLTKKVKHYIPAGVFVLRLRIQPVNIERLIFGKGKINQMALEGDSRMSKKAADKKFQTQNNLSPVFSNRFKQRLKRAKTVIQTATETIRTETADY